MVRLVDVNDDSRSLASVRVDVDGSFRVESVPVGSWRAEFVIRVGTSSQPRPIGEILAVRPGEVRRTSFDIRALRPGTIRGWLGTARRSSVGNIATMLHPDDESVIEDIVIAGLRRLSNTRSVFCVVPEYQFALSRTLEQQKFRPDGEFITLVKSTAKTVRESNLARSALASREPM